MSSIQHSASFFTSSRKTAFRKKLVTWFEDNKRTMPWRTRPDLYRVWVSEIMLQQTQVATVIDYFNRFIKRFPNVKRLAAADEQDVLKLWEGLGYYRRARQMHAAARVIVEKHSGEFPERYEDVLALPGVGRYTAGAVLSIGGGKRYPILEGNTERLFARLLALDSDPKSRESQNQLWAFSESLLPRKNVGVFNQALMELGSLICKPREPKCKSCPVANYCAARIQSRTDELPIKSNRTQYESVREAAVIIRCGKEVLLKKALKGQRWAGMWDVPRYRFPSSNAEAGHEDSAFLYTNIFDEFSIKIHEGQPKSFRSIQHAVTRFRIQLDCFQYRLRAKPKLPESPNVCWASLSEIENIGLNKTARMIFNELS